MCQLFVNADSDWWSSKTKSLRIDGVVTSIRLERFFWHVLEEIAVRDELTVNQMITRLYLESIDADHDISNFTSFLRVCCARYLSLIADGELVRDESLPLREVNASAMLESEAERSQRRTATFVDRGGKQSIN